MAMFEFSNRYALIIGINKYSDEGISDLKYAKKDADEFEKLLLLQKRFKIENSKLIKLVDKQATKENILEELSTLSERIGQNDLFIFFYAGHGCYEELSRARSFYKDDKLEKFIAPHNTQYANIKDTAISFERLHDSISNIDCKQMVAFFDCCYSGGMVGRSFSPSGKRGIKKKVGTEYLNAICGAGRVVVTACTGDEIAWEDNNVKQGVFTKYVLDGLKGAADYKGDDDIDLDELWLYLSDNLSKNMRAEKAQTPVRAGWVQGGPIHLSSKIEETLLPEKKIVYEIVRKYRLLRDVKISDGVTINSIATVAAEYLQGILTHNIHVAVSCGRTLIETINNLKRSGVTGLKIFPLNGSPSDEVYITDSMVLTYLLWSKLEDENTEARVVPTGIPPDIFKNIEEDLEKLATRVLNEAINSDVFIFGIGNPKSNKNIEYLLKKCNLTFKDLEDMGVVGEINFHLYDKEGQFLALKEAISKKERERIKRYNSKFFSISVEELYKLTKSSRAMRIIIAGGSEKREAIKAALKGGLCNVLITDKFTGDWLARDAMVDSLKTSQKTRKRAYNYKI